MIKLLKYNAGLAKLIGIKNRPVVRIRKLGYEILWDNYEPGHGEYKFLVNVKKGARLPKYIKELPLKRMVRIDGTDVSVNTRIHSDCGEYALEWECPNCGEKLCYTEASWSRTMSCSCRDWTLEIKVKGELKND